jgi:peptide/nickel transport system substrate-binding protein
MRRIVAHCALLAAFASVPAAAAEPVETPMYKDQVAAGKLPPVAKRVPSVPLVVAFDGKTTRPGRHGGTLNMIIGRSRDVRMLVVYGYARLVGYDTSLRIVPDILESIEVQDGRSFTMKLRKGHRWSDGKPFTTEDFRYYWEDVANDKELSPTGPPRDLLVDGEPPKVELIDELTVRYTWSKPNHDFLPRMAGASPAVHLPSGALPEEVPQEVLRESRRGREDGHREAQVVAGPQPPGQHVPVRQSRPAHAAAVDEHDETPGGPLRRERNPYFHRIDEKGQQLPYLDRVVLSVSTRS